MSVTMSVFLHSAKMPTPVKWSQACRSYGFDIEMDTDFDVRTSSGFRPCKYGGQDAGFEYFWESASEQELDDAVVAELGGREIVFTLNTHSDMRELMTSIIASAVLCAIADGVLWDTETNEFIPAADAIKWGKEMEANIKNELS